MLATYGIRLLDVAFENTSSCLLLLADSPADTTSLQLGILTDLAKGEPSLIAVGNAKNCTLCNNTSHTLTEIHPLLWRPETFGLTHKLFISH